MPINATHAVAVAALPPDGTNLPAHLTPMLLSLVFLALSGKGGDYPGKAALNKTHLQTPDGPATPTMSAHAKREEAAVSTMPDLLYIWSAILLGPLISVIFSGVMLAIEERDNNNPNEWGDSEESYAPPLPKKKRSVLLSDVLDSSGASLKYTNTATNRAINGDAKIAPTPTVKFMDMIPRELLNATRNVFGPTHPCHMFPQNFNETLADWTVQKKNFTGEAPLVVAVQNPSNAAAGDRGATLFSVWDKEASIGDEELATAGKKVGSLLHRGIAYASSTEGLAAFERELEDFKNATRIAQKLGGVAATFEEVFEA
ncbi:MAG: hypothetical protein M1831_000897 [Alyxoria varia]|nr:MAG: hypothetical protein M1831_000897 [Alyxoria varia]